MPAAWTAPGTTTTDPGGALVVVAPTGPTRRPDPPARPAGRTRRPHRPGGPGGPGRDLGGQSLGRAERMARVYVKICGLRTAEHARVAVEAGAAAVGVVMNRTSSRRATADEAREVVAAARGARTPSWSSTTCRPGRPRRTARDLGFDVLQLHGPAYDEADFREAAAIISRVWRATSLDRPAARRGCLGRGATAAGRAEAGVRETWDPVRPRGSCSGRAMAARRWPVRRERRRATAVAVRPWGVDVSSGVEVAPGEKSAELIRGFVAAARG